jgi:hypothetical protein
MKPPLWPFVVAILLIILAIPPGWPYGFYMLLRLVVCGVAIYGAMQANMQRREGWVWTLGGLAVLFNPLIPFHLGKDAWALIDLASAVLLGIAASILRRTPQSLPLVNRTDWFKRWAESNYWPLLMIVIILLALLLGFLFKAL